MSSILDFWQDSESDSDFGTTQSLRYFFRLVYKKKNKLFVFNFCSEHKFASIYKVGNISYFSKNWYFKFRFLAS